MQPDGLRGHRIMVEQLLSLRGRGAKKWEIFVQALGQTRKIKVHETHSREMMRRQPDFRVELSIKNVLVKELMLWSHRRRDVIRAKVLCCHYPRAEN